MTIGSSTSMAEVFGIPVKNHLVEKGPDGRDRPLPREKFYIPGSLLQGAHRQHQSAGLRHADSRWTVFFDNSPVFRLEPDRGDEEDRTRWGGLADRKSLHSGWAWGQQYLDGGAAVAEATVGEGKVFLLGPEVKFREQPHGTFKLLFNGLYYGSAKAAALK